MTRQRRRGLHRFRRVVQLAFLAAFLGLLFMSVRPLGQLYVSAFLVTDPLIALNSALHGLWLAPMWIAVVLLLAPVVAGRAFCGYVCPMGTLIERTSPKPTRGSRLPGPVRARLRLVPLLVLAACAGLALFAVGAFLFFDPLSLLTRTATVILFPLLDRVISVVSDVAYLAPPLRGTVDAVTNVLAGRLVFNHPLVYDLSVVALAVFGTVLATSWLEPRLWCRHLCPLGALYGTVGRAAVFGRVVDAQKCTSCGACARVCPLDAVGEDFHSTDTSRCQLCLACADACPTDAIRLGARPRKQSYSPSRRALLGTFGVAALTGFFTFTGLPRVARANDLIRPPGARAEADFLALCSRCGQCMKVCPTNGLQPTVTKAGLEGFLTPELTYAIGSCDWVCNECGKVCPTGAIRPLTLETKHKTKIGIASIDKNRCIPWAHYNSCIVCQEMCPVADKAIGLRTAQVVSPAGKKMTLQQPEVLRDRCIGCGMCENHCPAPGGTAIKVRAV